MNFRHSLGLLLIVLITGCNPLNKKNDEPPSSNLEEKMKIDGYWKLVAVHPSIAIKDYSSKTLAEELSLSMAIFVDGKFSAIARGKYFDTTCMKDRDYEVIEQSLVLREIKKGEATCTSLTVGVTKPQEDSMIIVRNLSWNGFPYPNSRFVYEKVSAEIGAQLIADMKPAPDVNSRELKTRVEEITHENAPAINSLVFKINQTVTANDFTDLSDNKVILAQNKSFSVIEKINAPTGKGDYCILEGRWPATIFTAGENLKYTDGKLTALWREVLNQRNVNVFVGATISGGHLGNYSMRCELNPHGVTKLGVLQSLAKFFPESITVE